MICSIRRHLVIVHPNVVPEALDMHGPVKRNVLGRISEFKWGKAKLRGIQGSEGDFEDMI